MLISLDGERDASRARSQREVLGSGLAAFDVRSIDSRDEDALARELGRNEQDLVIVSRSAAADPRILDGLMGSGEQHVLVVSGRTGAPRRALICVAAGEPGKHGVLVAGRILRHLGVAVTLLTAVSEDTPELRDQVARFQEASRRTLSLYGIDAVEVVREGIAGDVIVGEVQREGYDLVVLGSSMGDPAGAPRLEGLPRQLLRDLTVPALVVRHVEEVQ
jgi:nucleotide-binding universal stress UspA family protein